VPSTLLAASKYTGRDRPGRPSGASTWVAALTNTASIARTSRGSSGWRNPAAGHQKHHVEEVAARQNHNPTGRRGVPVTLSRIDHRQEPEDTGAQRDPCVLCPSGVVITQPQCTEGKAEDELADQNRLDGGQCGEDERASNARHPQQPHGLADEIVRGVPCRPLLLGARHIGRALQYRGQRLADPPRAAKPMLFDPTPSSSRAFDSRPLETTTDGLRMVVPTDRAAACRRGRPGQTKPQGHGEAHVAGSVAGFGVSPSLHESHGNESSSAWLHTSKSWPPGRTRMQVAIPA
jgi:hypothetical protein